MTHNRLLILLFPLLVLLSGCSTQKNTALSRSYHAMKVRYNVQYNGTNAFLQGLDAINSAHTDDYTRVLPLYPVSDHDAAKASTSQMDITIEKSRKSIKLHSIKKKPAKINEHRRSDPDYKAWLKQEEFNPAMPMAWLMLGKAEFHKGDFLESIGTFNYIQKHFPYDRDVVAQCQLWSVRAYAEAGWLYEAEDLLSKVKIDDLKRRNAPLFAAVTADLRLKQEQWREAIPFARLAMDGESRHGYRARFAYVLAQLYELDNQPARAREYYQKVIRLYPEWNMDFNARLHLQALNPDRKKAIRELTRMTALPKYKDHLDRLYGTIGGLYLLEGDTTRALESFRQGIDGSTQGGFAKAEVLLKAADLYFDRKDYVEAQPCYSEASTILLSTHPDYPRVKQRAEVLDELVVEVTTLNLQDSLQRLSLLSPEEQMAVAERLVAELVRQEKEDSVAAAQAERDRLNGVGGLQSVNTSNMLGGGAGSSAWYFYNANLLRQGKQQFQKKWGNRPLEDNWRRQFKSASSMTLPSLSSSDDEEYADSLSVDSLGASLAGELVSDPHDPRYYLMQIPSTEEDIAASNQMIADALYHMVGIYRDKLDNETEAAWAADELKRRFPENEHLEDLYYTLYLSAHKEYNAERAAHYRERLLAEFPDGRYASLVQDSLYFEHLRQSLLIQDSLYALTYEAYKQGQFASVKATCQEVRSLYPLSPLMPRFLFLNAVSVARTDGQDAFVEALQPLVEDYPESAPGVMGKNMLAMMNLGSEAQTGGKTSSLDEQREALLQEELEETADEQPVEQRHVVYVVVPQDTKQLHTALYEVALFNFSQFMIKEFDLNLLENYSPTESAVEIQGFDSAEEVAWYKGLLQSATITHKIRID